MRKMNKNLYVLTMDNNMRKMQFDNYPKSIKKTLRYIKQDASLSQLETLELMLIKSIEIRKKNLQRKHNIADYEN